MQIAIIGDVHGDWDSLNTVIRSIFHHFPETTHIVQVGDFGHGWPQVSLTDPYNLWKIPDAFKRKKRPFHFLDGNHENFEFLKKFGSGSKWLTYQPRGSILEIEDKKLMFFGGATSIDKEDRIIGRSWWPDENIKKHELDAAINLDIGTVDAIFSHEHPESIPYRIKSDLPDGYSDRVALDILYNRFKPKFWFFGHWHKPDFGIMDDLTWTCCPSINNEKMYVIWDGKQVIPSWTVIKSHKLAYERGLK